MFNCIWEPKDLRYAESELTLHTFDCWLWVKEYMSHELVFLGEEYNKIMKEFKWGALDINSREADEFL